MPKRERYVEEPEPLHDSQGRLVDDAYVELAVEDAREYVRNRGGRPSLSSGESPQVRLRVTPELRRAIDAAASADHVSPSEWMRRALHRAASRRLAKRT